MTRFLDNFYRLKIGIPWTDVASRLDVASVLALCGEEPMKPEPQTSGLWRSMGVDTGKALHVVVLESDASSPGPERVIHLGVYGEFGELDGVMERFGVRKCVIDGYPETHITQEFARRHPHGRVYLCSFNTTQRGKPQWDRDDGWVHVHRTDALDMSRAAIRDKKVVLPREEAIVREFAEHMACDAKVLDEDQDTGAKRYRYIRTGADHLSLAFTYAWLAATGSVRINLADYGWIA